MGRRNAEVRLTRKRNYAPYIMLAPWFIGFLVFKVYPIGVSLYNSFMEYPLLGEPTFVGLDNFIKIFTNDPTFRRSITATLQYVLIGTPCVLLVSFFVAYILNFKLRGVNFFRTAYYIPSILGGNVAVAILWTMLFNNNGPINQVLGIFGIEPVVWLRSEPFALITLIVLKTWQFGSTMLIFLAALQNVSPSLYEAGALDGASKPRMLFSITLPVITPMVLFNCVNVLVKAFQEFNSAYLITKTGPNFSTYFLNVYIYEEAFVRGNYGYASALTWIMLAIIGALTAMIFSSSRYWVFYND